METWCPFAEKHLSENFDTGNSGRASVVLVPCALEPRQVIAYVLDEGLHTGAVAPSLPQRNVRVDLCEEAAKHRLERTAVGQGLLEQGLAGRLGEAHTARAPE